MPLTITAVTPDNDVISGGELITIDGTSFLANVRVRIGGANATIKPGTLTATQMVVVAPSHARAEQVLLEVRNTTGAAVTHAFYYRPLLTSIVPSVGPLTGLTAVTIRGEGFHGLMTVAFGPNAAIAPTVVSATEITCTTPANAGGVQVRVDVDVLLPGVAMGSRMTEAFGYSPPIITSVEPTVVPLAGGVNVTVRGRLFAGAAGAAIDAANIVPTINSDTEIVLVAPAHAAGPVPVSVTNGGLTGTLANAITYAGAVIAKVTPKRGPEGQTTNVVITGERFAGLPAVDIGGNAANVTAGAPARVTAVAPVHAAGVVDVVVTNAGEPAVTLNGGFTYVARPAITTVEPAVGRLAGGTAVTISGTGFEPAVGVTIGGTPVGAMQFVSATTIIVFPGRHAAGLVDVVATNPDGNPGTLQNGFTYSDVTAVTPKRGSVAGGTVVTIRGDGFVGGVAVTFGGQAAANVVVGDRSTLTATTPAHAPGAVEVAVGASRLASGFTYSSLTEVAPADGPLAGRQVTLTGEGFGAGTTVAFGGAPGLNVNVTASTSLTVDPPAVLAAATVDVKVRRETRFANAFTYYDPVVPAGGVAAVTAVYPSVGLTAGGTSVVIRGVGFGDGATVRFGNNDANVTARGANEITAVTPQGAVAGPIRVQVTWNVVADEQPQSVSVHDDNLFRYQDVLAVNPAAGPAAGGTVVTITGDGFGDGVAVTFGGTAANPVAVDSATSVRATTPAGGAGTVDVVAVREGTAASAFTYYDAAHVDAVEPADGLAGGGRRVLIRGSGFALDPDPRIGGVQLTNINRLSATVIEGDTGAHLAGPADVEVTNPNTLAGTLPGAFTYRDAATVTGVAPPTGGTEGGRWITVTGTGFVRGAAVLIDGVAAPPADTVYTDAQTISARVQAHVAGPVGVGVRNPGELAVTMLNAFTYVVTPAETGENEVVFLMDGEAFFTEFKTLMNAVRAAAPDPLTYVRMAFWMIEKEVCLGDANDQKWPEQHELPAYVDQLIRAGHGVDVIMWEPGQVERKFSEAKGVQPVNLEFGRAVAAIDEAAAGVPGAGRARVYHERYEGPVGSSTHQKIVIASIAGQRTALVGGINLARNYFSDNAHATSNWHDVAVRLIGPVTDDVEAEWVRRWKKTSADAASKVLKVFGAAGVVRARNFAFNATATVRTEAVRLADNKTRQTPHADNRSVTIATTRADGDTRYRRLRDLLLQKIAAANQYIYMENYHFTDPQLVRAIYQRHEARRQAGVELRVVIVVPLSGGGSGYLTRRSWLQMVLRMRRGTGPVTFYTTRVHYDTGGGPRTVDPAACNAWVVTDPYDDARPTDERWFAADRLVFTAAGVTTRVPFQQITGVESSLHFYSVFNLATGQNIYTHSKVAIIDDELIVGSANWSYRSMQYDGEMSAFTSSNHLATNALAGLLAHYDTATALNVNIIDAEAQTNVDGMTGANAIRQIMINNQTIVLPVCAWVPADLGLEASLALPRNPPGFFDTPPNHTWL